MTPNCVPAIECHYAIAGWAGGVVLNLNQRLSPDELAYCLRGADCEVLVADTSFARLVKEEEEGDDGDSYDGGRRRRRKSFVRVPHPPRR